MQSFDSNTDSYRDEHQVADEIGFDGRLGLTSGEGWCTLESDQII